MKNSTLLKVALMTIVCFLATTASAQRTVFAETFANFSNGKPVTSGGGTGAAVADVNTKTAVPGWTGVSVYESGGYIKMGTSSKPGSIETPAIDLSANGGVFTVSFQASNWSGQSGMVVSVNGTEYPVNTVYTASLEASPVTSFPVYEVIATGGTAATKIKFTGGSNTRFLMGDLKVTQIDATGPTVALNADKAEFGLVAKDASVTKTIRLTGISLTSDLVVTTAGEGFQCTTTAITKEAAAQGQDLSIVFNPTAYKDYAGTVTISGGGLAASKVITLSGKGIKVEAANLAELRTFDADGTTLYTLLSKPVLTFADAFRNTKFIQDATGAILIDDYTKKIATVLAVGDEITGLKGTLAMYNGMLQFTPSQDIVKGLSGQTVTPTVKTLAQLTVADQATLVKVPNLTFTMTDSKDAPVTDFVGATSYKLVNSDVIVRTQYKDVDYINLPIPTKAQDLTALVLVYNSTVQLVPRSGADFADAVNTGITMEKLAGIYTSNDKVYVPAVAGEKIFVTNTLGQTISVITAIEGINEISGLPVNQLLFVKVGNKVAKVIL